MGALGADGNCRSCTSDDFHLNELYQTAPIQDLLGCITLLHPGRFPALLGP